MTNCEKDEEFVCISCVEEVRYSFVSHLSEALRRKGINNVVVDVDIDDLLFKESQAKIEKAGVSVMVLPGNCDPSEVWLDKFAKVLECQRNNKDQAVVSVLYGDSLLRDQWLSELDFRGLSRIHQSRKECSDSILVEEIVRDVYETHFYVGRIGIYSKLLEIENMVNKQPIGIRCVGIWGMPGIGKTTLAKAVFDQMSSAFDASCFIEDYDKSIHEKGLYCLLEEQLLPGNDATIMKLSSLRDRLNSKRVLVVLDDVRNALVGESFLEGFDWLGPGSLIIITSRDKQVFCLCGINQIYEVQGLNEKEARQLFLLSASIKEDMGEQNLQELSVRVINYANGNPLAISVYGRELKGKKKLSEMETAFLKLKRRPPFKIVDAFKSTYDTLSDNEKNIFLDIACFFQGENVNYVIQLLEGCGFFPHVEIDVLVDKCLVTISENRVWLHKLTQDIGREIINGETVQIERRRRLWEPWSIKYLLEYNEHKANGEPKTTFKRAQGSEEIEGLFLDTSNLRFDLQPSAFKNMLNLRLLKIYCSNPEVHPVINFPTGSLHSLPNELRLLHWENYPLKSLPQNFDPRHLVEINMPYSQLQKLWGGTKNLEMLRTIRLCHSHHLVDIDDLLKAENLEVIDLQGCTRLQNFPAAGRLLRLRVVNLSGCIKIKSVLEIPPNIEKLHLQGTGILALPVSTVKPNHRELVNFLTEIPGLSEELERLTSLLESNSSCQDLGKLICLELKDCSCLQSLPNMANLDLNVLDLSGCSSLNSIQGFPRFLKQLYLGGTAIREVPQLPQSLEILNAHGSCLRSLPNMANLEFLKVLDLSGCSELETIQGFPRNLKELYFAGTTLREVPQLPLSLEVLNAHGSDSEKLPMHYKFNNFFDLSQQVVNDFLLKTLTYVKHIPRGYTQELINKAPTFSFSAPSHTNQNATFDLQSGSSVMTRLNHSWRNTLVGFGMLVEVAFPEDYCDATDVGISCVCRWSNKEGRSCRIERKFHCWAPWQVVPKVRKDHTFVFSDVNMRPSTGEGNDPDIWAGLVVFEFFPINQQTKCLNDRFTVRRCGVRVINVATGNTSLENIALVLSLDPVEVSGYEVLRVSYDDLQEMDKVLFLYIASLFNDEDVDFVAPLIAGIDLDVSSGLKVLADVSLISVSSNGEIVMHSLQRQMGKEILHGQSMLLSDCESSMTENLSDVPKKKKKHSESRVKKVVSIPAIDEGDLWTWRKYGQKDILGSRFPRGYYRCAYKFTHGCKATKQVQRSETDSNMLAITYLSEHNHPRPTKRKALADSTRSTSSSIC
ncbi:Disease resistance protein (TIR-NBS-LRR class) [Arabidopsis thaliana]|uniref:Disease resistance protein RRS1 n=2 Tax=Arabidopsis thaliana TaxID=3702 RepID=WRK52_ARATH|nr:Disease resistance protein (TIR-NBS-LRR class) [Arabidopsis thaliana]P0DKH5.1 RecName: Full=Disease resistance protein RRS1; AltName: Full=Disease resistance protein RCH2; AltName: Full=Disease resistance protein SLH1; AltName: Full=Probable WRKY transcription factor 52; AltName: Full=Protein RPS4-homolog; AltName: Full=Protein SENSITIVE TO LOW HUMIDITY 1; AltName: Full=Resistance to Colletotrichum higginsianum 2 protein; AltName: Full=Resistance to Ralstonia solanacearum 1 protein; AltName: Fu|eukprot:NP_199339.2 Disease resistance protein (TIR-NBS-LRR class) [Arabidopsis thaliana]